MINYNKAIEWKLDISEIFFLTNSHIFFENININNIFTTDLGSTSIVDSKLLLERYPFLKSKKKIFKLIDKLTKKEIIKSIWFKGNLHIARTIKSKEWYCN